MGSSEMSDAELLSFVAAHDARALRIFHDRHAPWVLARLRHRCSNDDVVFDALQDTFVAVWRSADSWRGEGEPAAWLWGIASRRLIGVQRNRTRCVMRVWIDQDLCTGDGLCTDHCPEVFMLLEDGMSYVREAGTSLATGPGQRLSIVPVTPAHESNVIDAALECPGECIFIEEDATYDRPAAHEREDA